MLKPSADLIIDPKQSRYALVVAIAKHAREIAEEAEKNGEILVDKPVDLSVHNFMTHDYIITEDASEDEEEEPAAE